ncbi:MAG: MBL fold metallo-hydrolase [Myxococcota bacterium]
MSGLVFVGTSDAFGAGGRRQSAILLRAASGTALVDCGATTNSGLVQLGIERSEIDAILISHFHADHFAGIPVFLLAAQFEDNRTRPLVIAGPTGIEQRVRQLAEAMGHPLDDREVEFEVSYQELDTGRATAIGPVSARAFETHHDPMSCPHGLIIEAGNRRIAYSGDTGWFDRLPHLVAGCDVFICECTLHKPAYEYHLDLETLDAKRDQFDCGRMLLTHLGAEMSNRRGKLEIETADDGLAVDL